MALVALKKRKRSFSVHTAHHRCIGEFAPTWMAEKSHTEHRVRPVLTGVLDSMCGLKGAQCHNVPSSSLKAAKLVLEGILTTSLSNLLKVCTHKKKGLELWRCNLDETNMGEDLFGTGRDNIYILFPDPSLVSALSALTFLSAMGPLSVGAEFH